MSLGNKVDNKTEIWKTYKFSEYSTIEVSNFGNIKKDNKELIKRTNKDGYFVVGLNKGKDKKGYDDYRSVFVHRLVACAFIEERLYEDGWEVNHKDYNRKNNNVENLEWLTHEENVKYSICNRPDFNGEKNPNYGNKKLSKIYRENPNYALEKQSRKGIENGRCVKIRMYNKNGFDKTFDFIRLCVDYIIENNISNTKKIDSIRGQIDRCIKGNKSYRGYYFNKIR